MTSAYQAAAESMHRNGYSDQQIADETGMPLQEVTDITTTTRAQDQADKARELAQAVTELADLITWACAHPEQAVRDQAVRAVTEITALKTRRAADEELATLSKEEAVLQERLTQLQARKSELLPTTGPAKKTKGKTTGQRDHEPEVVRAWAKQNGYDCNDRGRVPRPLVDRWIAAGRPQPRPVAA